MKIRTSIAAAAAAALVGAGAFMLPAAASARATTHTLTFVSVTKASVNFSSSTGAQQNTDVNGAGKVVGYDMLYFSVVSRTTAALTITLDTKGGMLYGTAKINLNTGAVSNGKGNGRNRCVQGRYRNAHGQES